MTVEHISLRKKLFKIQGKVGIIKKDGQAPLWKFTTLPSLLAHLLPIFRSYGLLLTTETRALTHGVVNEGVTISHTMDVIIEDIETGERKFTTVPMILDSKSNISKNGVVQNSDVLKSFGKTSTYCFRYGLITILGMCPELDTDGFPAAFISEDRLSTENDIISCVENLDESLKDNPHVIKIRSAINSHFNYIEDESLQKMYDWLVKQKVNTCSSDHMQLTLKLHDLWKMKEGSIRADETVMSNKVINMFKTDLIGVPYKELEETLIWMRSI